MRKYTFGYKMAWILLILMLLTAVFGGMIKPHSIDPSQKILINTDPAAITKTPPFPPDSKFLLGTDHRGFDLLSLLLNGMKFTLGFALVITVCRFLLALPLGLLSGATGRGTNAISFLQWITTSVPPLLFLFPPLWAIYTGLKLGGSLASEKPNYLLFNLIFLGMMIVIGVFPLAYQMRERTRFYTDKLFVTASGLMGGSILHRIWRHVLPSLRTEILFAFIAEYVQVLFLMGQLALLGIFLGGGDLLDFGDGFQINLAKTGEWCPLIVYGATTVRIRLYPWIILSVGVFYTASILVLQFFLMQMKKQYSEYR